MKSILIIGLGRFGRHLCRKFMSLKNEVMIVDRDEAAVTALADEATSAQIADCTDENALRALGVKNFDLCFVCIGSDFASSLLITSMLKDMGAARVVAKASQDIHAKLLLRNGADAVTYPEKQLAKWAAIRYTANHIFSYMEPCRAATIGSPGTSICWRWPPARTQRSCCAGFDALWMNSGLF